MRHISWKVTASLLLLFGLAAEPLPGQAAQQPQQTWPTPQEGDYVVHDFHFRSGETLPEVRLHYYTLGKPVKTPAGARQTRF